MLTPLQLDRLPEAIVALFADLESALRVEAAASVVSLDVAQSAATRAAIAARAASYSREAERIVIDTMTQAARTSLLSDERIYEAARAAGILAEYPTLRDAVNLDSILATGISTAKSLVNYTVTQSVLNVSNDFTDALDRAVFGIVTGRTDPATAIRRAVRDISRTTSIVTYPSGRRDSVYGAARRAILTSANQTTLRMQEARLRDVGAEFVEVSAHSGARPEHAEWQGQVMPFDSLPERTGYGTGEGLGGWN